MELDINKKMERKREGMGKDWEWVEGKEKGKRKMGE